jgi:hypothetical protein
VVKEQWLYGSVSKSVLGTRAVANSSVLRSLRSTRTAAVRYIVVRVW